MSKLDTHDVQDLIDPSAINDSRGTSLVVEFEGAKSVIDVNWQKGKGSSIQVEFMTKLKLAKAIQPLRWCGPE